MNTQSLKELEQEQFYIEKLKEQREKVSLFKKKISFSLKNIFIYILLLFHRCYT